MQTPRADQVNCIHILSLTGVPEIFTTLDLVLAHNIQVWDVMMGLRFEFGSELILID